jgi:hypothetical protein
MRNACCSYLARGLIVFTVMSATAGRVHAGGVEPPKGFTALFNGKDLSGWHPLVRFDLYKLAALTEAEQKTQIEKWIEDAKKHWNASDGELVSDGNGRALSTDKELGDIELLVDFKTGPNAHGGISLRGAQQWEIPASKEGSAWQSFRILLIGERTTVYLNDKLVVKHARMENVSNRNLPLPKQGPIQLSAEGSVRWRNIFVRQIPPAEANEVLRQHNAAGFEDVFNGKDFTGWAGPIDQYEVKNGAIVCLPKKGGTIYTKEEYSDFVARLEFKLPPAGNNGLAIRYPGKGDTAYVGMCEIQVLDDTAPVYAKLDPRQYNGSAYGMVPAHRGYLRPLGEWNFEEVTIIGSTIKVELNGTLILDTDLSKVTEYMAKRPHPGKDRKIGYFGFAGHNDPVAFRKIQIKRLEQK